MRSRRPDGRLPASGPAPFDGQLLFDLAVEAAEVLHRDGDLKSKLTWTTEAIRVATGASHVAYVELNGGTPMVRATAGTGKADARRIVGAGTGGLLDRVRRTRRPAQLPEFPHPDEAAVVALPVLGSDDRLHGALVVAVPPGTPVEIAGWVGAGLGLHLGAAIDTHRNIRRLTALEAAQREVVTQLQEAVRPPEPVMPTAEFGVYFLSADPDAPTGGDLYDWHLLPSGELHVAVIDVVGKGVTATKHALAVMHALRILALEECPLAHLVARASDVLGDAHPDLVATLVVARYHPDTGRVRLVGGGHPPALVVSTNGGVEQIDVPGVPIGWPDAGSVSVAERFLDHDDTLLLYTDGLVEAQRDVLAGLAQLEVAAKEVSEYPARYMARALVERALAGSTRRDDTLALVLRHRVRESSLGPHLGPFHYRFSPTSATVPLARHLLGDWLHLQPVDVRHCDDLLFIATELAANAVTAASGAPQAVELRAWLDEDAVVVEVEDDGPGFQLNPHHEEPPAEAEAGRGLFLVRALADDLTTERRGGCTVTRAVKRAVVRPAPGN